MGGKHAKLAHVLALIQRIVGSVRVWLPPILTEEMKGEKGRMTFIEMIGTNVESGENRTQQSFNRRGFVGSRRLRRGEKCGGSADCS
jgi:hypothetical protein